MKWRRLLCGSLLLYSKAKDTYSNAERIAWEIEISEPYNAYFAVTYGLSIKIYSVLEEDNVKWIHITFFLWIFPQIIYWISWEIRFIQLYIAETIFHFYQYEIASEIGNNISMETLQI